MYGERGDGKEKIIGGNFSAEGKIYVKNVHGISCLIYLLGEVSPL